MAKTSRKNPTITFQADAETKKVLEAWQKLGRGELSEKINAAIRDSDPKTALNIILQQRQELDQRIEELKKRIANE